MMVGAILVIALVIALAVILQAVKLKPPVQVLRFPAAV